MMAFGLLSILQLSSVIQAEHGDPDPTFGFRGLKIDHAQGKSMTPRGIAQQADGKLLVVGKMEGSGYPFDLLLLRRYNDVAHLLPLLQAR